MDLVGAEGSANVDDLAQRFHVSAATIRRDLDALARAGQVVRTHGGVLPPHRGTSFEPFHREKRRVQPVAKAAIARAAARRVREGQVVVLDSGSTTLALAHELRALRNLTVVTSDLTIALELAASSSHDVIVTGGRVRSQLFSAVGPLAEAGLRQLYADHAFLGADAIHATRGVTNANVEEAAVKRLAVEGCRRATLLADHTKFDRVSLAFVCGLDAFDEVLTDAALDEATRARYRQAGVPLTIAGEEDP